MDGRAAARAVRRRAADRLRRHPVQHLPRSLLRRHRRQRARRRALRARPAHGTGLRWRHGIRLERDPGVAGLPRAAGSGHPRRRAAGSQVRAEGEGRARGAGRYLLPRARAGRETAQPLRLMPNRWLFKTEPGTYSYDQLERERRTVWDGVKNALALKHLSGVAEGDEVVFYHTGGEKAVVGVDRGAGRARTSCSPDPTSACATPCSPAFFSPASAWPWRSPHGRLAPSRSAAPSECTSGW